MNFHQSFKKCSILTPDNRKQPQTSLDQVKRQIKVQKNMDTRGSCVHDPMVKFWEASRISFMQFSQNIDGSSQNDLQG